MLIRKHNFFIYIQSSFVDQKREKNSRVPQWLWISNFVPNFLQPEQGYIIAASSLLLAILANIIDKPNRKIMQQSSNLSRQDYAHIQAHCCFSTVILPVDHAKGFLTKYNQSQSKPISSPGVSGLLLIIFLDSDFSQGHSK